MRQKQNQSMLEKVYLHLLRSRWTKVASVLASVAVFCTVYALILPAITLSSQTTRCGYEEHTHTAECYDAENNLICGLEEHMHTLACYSDPNADVEGWDVWMADIPELTGDPRADIVAIAASQVGYKESDKNYLVSNENQTQGYTRYGHWYGDVIDGSGERLANGLSEYAYTDWDAIFASFVLEQAGVRELGSDIDAGNWAGALGASGHYADAADYTPQAGDLIFFTPEAGAKVNVGIITDVNKGYFGLFGNTIHSFSVIAGNSDNSVQEIKVAVDSRKDGDVTFETIHGYGIIPSEENKTDYSVSEEIKGSPADADQSAPVDEATADQAATTEEGNTEVAPTEQTVIPADESTAGQPAVPTDESTAGLIMAPTGEIMSEQPAVPVDESTTGQNAVPVDESVAGQPVVSADESAAEQFVAPADESTAGQAAADDTSVTGQETVPADVTTAEEAIIAAQEAEEQTESVVPGLAEDTNRIVGKSEKDLESAEVTEKDGVTVSVAEYHLTDDGSALIMNWKAETQLEEGILPAGAIIRVDTATGKNHGLTAAQAKSWGGAAVICGEATALVDNDNYEITFIGDNGNLYTWTDVQGMSEESVVTFTGIHVKVLNDVKAAGENNSVELAFETTAKIADANAGMNYYVTRVSINDKTGSENFSYKNGEAVPVDQDKVLQDAGLVNDANVKTLTVKKSDYIVTMSYGPEAGIPEGSKLYVKEIRKGTEEYNTYIEDAKAALGINGAAEAELQGRFFDIKIMTKDGEFEPKAPVNVNIEYREAIETQDASNVSAVHFSKDGAESIPVDATDISAAQDDMAKVKAVEFSAESFSVYGVVYTVDFEYSVNGKMYQFSLPGGEKITLSDLVEVLGIIGDTNSGEKAAFNSVEDFLKEVANVQFSDESLVKVTPVEGDWELESLQPFSTDEDLTITMKNGNVMSVKVTDAQGQGMTADVYFTSADGHTHNASTETGTNAEARIALSNSNPDQSIAHVRVDISMDPGVSLNTYMVDGEKSSIVIQSSTGNIEIGYTYHANNGHPYIVYDVPPGATGVAELSFSTPNGKTPSGKSVTLTPSACDENGNPIQGAGNDNIGDPAKAEWVSAFNWDDAVKTVNAPSEHLDSNKQLTDWLRYNISANSGNRQNKGVIWTDTITVSDTLTLPEGVTVTDVGNWQTRRTETGWNLVDNSGNIIMGLSGLNNYTMQTGPSFNVSDDGKTITYSFTVVNPTPDSAEIANLNFQAELNLGEMTLSDNFKNNLTETSNAKIVNSVTVEEKPLSGESISSSASAETTILPNDGYTLTKESPQDGTHVRSGETIEYTVTLTNTGSTPLKAGEKLVDTLPNEVFMTDSQKNSVVVKIGDTEADRSKLSFNGNQLIYDASGLEAGKTITITYCATVKDAEALKDTVEGTVISNNVNYRDAHKYTSVTLEKDHYTVDKSLVGSKGSAQDPAKDGDTVEYKLTASYTKKNDAGAPDSISPVVLDDILPPYMQLIAYDQGGTQLTDLYTSSAWGREVYIKNSESALIKATVYINSDGSTHFTIHDDNPLSTGQAREYGYQVKFAVDKATEKDVDENGNVHYTNIVTTPNGDKDEEPFEGSHGKLEVEKSHNDNGILLHGDGEVLTYTINVHNDPQNPYTKNIPVIDQLPAGLFPVNVTADEVTYTDKEALDNYLGSDEKTFTTEYGRSVTIKKNGTGYTMTWELANSSDKLITTEQIKYDAKIDAGSANTNAGGYATLENTVTVPGAKDIDLTEVKVPGLESDKIVISVENGGEKLDDHKARIDNGSKVTYQLKLTNPTSHDIVATNVKDDFPWWASLSNLPQSDQYWNSNTVQYDNAFQAAISDPTQGNSNLGNNRIEWKPVKVPAGQTITQTVTLTFPSQIELYTALFKNGGNSLNTFHVDGLEDVTVDHEMENNLKFMLQKSVVGFQNRKQNGSTNHGSNNNDSNTYVENSRDIFKRGSINEVYYSVVLANTGGTDLHVDSFTDYLPEQLELLGLLAGPSQWRNTTTTEQSISGTSDAFSNCYTFDNKVLEQNNTYAAVTNISVQGTSWPINISINNGKGVDIPPRHVVAFYMRCKVKESVEALTGVDALTNTIQAKISDQPEIKKTSLKENYGAGGTNTQNNGGCSIVSRNEEENYTIAESSVTIHPIDGFVPGIKKQAKQYTEYNGSTQSYDSSWTALREDHNQNIHSQSKVQWEITLYNDGTEPIHGYTLTDTIPEGHRFASQDHAGGNILPTAFAINGTSKDLNSDAVVVDNDGKTITITFPEIEQYDIPAGGTATITLTSDFIGTQQFQGRIDNDAIFTPKDSSWNANLVKRGQLVKNEDGTEYIGVSSSDYVNAYGSKATSSYKKIESEDGESAYGYDENNVVTVPMGSQKVKYTLAVTNLSQESIKTFTLIERMPEIGDTGVINSSVVRGSEFPVAFDGVPKLTRDHGTWTEEISPQNYVVEFSAKTEFNDEDWKDGRTGWSTDMTGAKSMRIRLINNYELPTSERIFVEFSGTVGADALPGQVAYNSFGYWYTDDASDTQGMKAEPPKVGVKIEEQPSIQKSVVDENGISQGADPAKVFEFKFYDVSNETDTEIEGLNLASVEPVETLQVAQGASVNLVKSTAGGKFEEGHKYLVVESPVSGYEAVGYTVGGLKKSSDNRVVFTYQAGTNFVIVAQNKEVAEVDLHVVKIEKGNSSKKLPGAKFKVTLLDAEQSTAGNVVKKTETDGGQSRPVFSKEYGPTNDSGELTITGLTNGYYMVEESQTPAGYVISTADPTFYIHVDLGEITYLVRSTDPSDAVKKLDEWNTSDTGSGLVTYAKATKTATVENEPGAALPQTGGPGTRLFSFFGSILILGAGVLLWRRRRLI